MALFENAFNVSAPRTGDANISKLDLTGWSNNPLLEDGRLYWIVTAANVLELYSNELKAAADLVCSGTIDPVTDKVTLAEVGGSGIEGSAIVAHTLTEEATGEVTLTYCDELDLLVWEKRLVDDYLDANDVFIPGTVRFEQVLKQAKITIDKQLHNKLKGFWPVKANGMTDLSAIAIPRELSDVHALYTLFLIYMSQNSGDTTIIDLAEKYQRMSKDELDLTQVSLDYGNDDKVDDVRSTQGGRLTR